MRKIFVLLGLLVPLSPLAGAQTADLDTLLGKAYQDALDNRVAGYARANREYRTAITTMFKYADRIEIFLLDPQGGLDNDEASIDAEAFRCDLERTKGTRILKQKTVPTRDIPKWCAATTKLLTSGQDHGGAFSHVPVHGIRIWVGEHAIFQTSFCWDSQTYYFDYRGGAQWVNISQDGADLKKLFTKAMPMVSPDEINNIRAKLFAEEATKAKVRKARWAEEDRAKAAKEAEEAKAKEAKEAEEAKAKEIKDANDAKDVNAAKETKE